MNLTSAKIVKVERNGKKQACMFFPLPRRLLSYGKIVKVERNGKKTGVHVFSIAETPPVLWKDSESRAQWEKTGVHIFPHCRGAENRGGIEIGWSSEGHFVLWKLICYFASNIKR